MARRCIPINKLVWSITDHICRRPVEDGGFCGGRIVSKMLDDRKPFSRCTCCGLESPGPAKSICMCGEVFHNGKRSGADAGLRCVRNENQTRECPDEIVVRYVEPSPADKKTGKQGIKHDANDLFADELLEQNNAN